MQQPILKTVRPAIVPSSCTISWAGRAYTVSIEEFGPERAAEVLDKNVSNRPLSRSNIRNLAASLKRREWALNGETIIFDWNGFLRQGQHRMEAVLLSGVPIVSLVMYGVDPASFATMDNGKRRSASDAMSIAGEVNTSKLAAAVRAIVKIKDGPYALTFFSPIQALEVLDKHPSLSLWVDRLAGNKDLKEFMPAMFCGALCLLSERHGTEVASQFFEEVASGIGLAAGQPSYLLRERFRSQSRTTKLHDDVKLAMIIKAMNAHVSGKTLNFLRWSTGEPFPKLI